MTTGRSGSVAIFVASVNPCTGSVTRISYVSARSSVTFEVTTPWVAASNTKLEPSVTRNPSWRRLSASTVGYRRSARVPCTAVNHTLDWRPDAVPIASLSPQGQWSTATLAAGGPTADQLPDGPDKSDVASRRQARNRP